MKKIKTQFRQGDIFIERLSTPLPPGKDAKEGDRIILAHGEVTNHCHELCDVTGASVITPDVPYLMPSDMDNAKMTQLIMLVGTKTAVKHDEHSRIPVTPGIYRVTRQREYSPAAIRNVAD